MTTMRITDMTPKRMASMLQAQMWVDAQVAVADIDYTNRYRRPSEFSAQLVMEGLVIWDDEDELPALNLELLRQHIGWIEKAASAPDAVDLQWDQSLWVHSTDPDLFEPLLNEVTGRPTGYYRLDVKEGFCNTACCLAGSVAISEGQPQFTRDGADEDFTASFMETGEPIESFARDQLGLTERESDVMFNGNNSVDDLIRLAEAVCLRRGLTL